MASYSPTEITRAGLGALVGIASAGLVARALPGGPETLPFLIAPMGASAVLLFAVPASPLAQPWAVLGGNLISTVIGLLAHALVPGDLLAPALAVGMAIGVMMLLRCLHPPGGACALLAATASPAVVDQAILFVLTPVAVNTAVLLLLAWAVNNLTGRSYPHRGAAPTRSSGAQLSIDADDIDAELERMARTAQRLDVHPGDVIELLRRTEERALDRRLGSLSVASVMHTDVAVAHPFESIYRARTVMVQRRVKTLPVVDAERRVVGVLSIIDLFSRDLVELETVEAIMRTEVVTVPATAAVATLVGLMTQDGYKNLPVVDDEERLVGMITRGDLLAVLHRALVGDG